MTFQKSDLFVQFRAFYITEFTRQKKVIEICYGYGIKKKTPTDW